MCYNSLSPEAAYSFHGTFCPEMRLTGVAWNGVEEALESEALRI